jgi:5'-nucleotidase
VVSGEITGRQLDTVLEAQWQTAADGSVANRPIAVSGNVTYRVDLTAAVGQRVSDIRLQGARIGQGKRYRVATTAGGYLSRYAPAGITAFLSATDQRRSEYNAGDALWRWMEAKSPVSPPRLGRARATLN